MNDITEVGKDGLRRCGWAYAGSAMVSYHDEEWGIPVESDPELWAKLVLDTFQAGLSWRLVLEKREGFLAAFDGLDPEAVAAYDELKVETLMADPGIVRNEAKIRAAISNAQAYLKLRAQEGSFRRWLFQYVNYRPLVCGNCPKTTPEAQAMAKGLKRAGFKFAGPIVCYAFMQATGFVMDHSPGCFRVAACTEMLRLPPGTKLFPTTPCP